MHAPRRGPSPAPRLDQRALVVSVLVAGGLVGTMEGWIYPGTAGLRAPLYTYWSFMISVLFLALLGALSGFTTTPLPKAALVGAALTLLPAALVVQDAASLLGQGHAPWTTDWYRHVFGDSVLTRHYAGLPGWYYGAIALTLALVALASAAPRGRRVGDA